MVVPRSCQGGAKAWGTLRSINQMDAKVGKGKGAKGGNAKGIFPEFIRGGGVCQGGYKGEIPEGEMGAFRGGETKVGIGRLV